jgi:hypothetical protein
MRIPFRRRHAARRRPLSPLSDIFIISSVASLPIQALNFTPVNTNVDLSQLGSVGIAGDFSGLSLYQFQEQNENPFSTNGSQSLLARLPNSVFASVVQTDASIMSMCSYILNNGSMSGVVLGGNFTSLANMQSSAIALFNPNTSQITPLAGLSGMVNAVLCDSDRNQVFVGGNFKGLTSTNAIAWTSGAGWTNLPFSGFNGPVTSITKASNGHIIFGGRFTGLGNASIPTTQRDGQVINLSNSTITSGSSTSQAGFSDPRNIVCRTGGAGGAGSTWLLQDNTPGFWQADFDFGFQPTKIRLRNTRQGGRGTRTWRFTALPINGIMNFTYIDPASGQNQSCTNQCPLSNDPDVEFQDFHFVNVVGMSSFRLDISEFYGAGGGLNGIELFQNDIFAYAINRFNEPTCAGSGTISSATATGPWAESPSFQSQSKYLTAQLSSPVTQSSASVIFTPDIREGGNFSVNMYTPGCMQDGSCATRGQVTVTMNMVAGRAPTTVQLYQTNNFDKYDQIYFGNIDASSGSFRPSVTMTPLNGQSLDTQTIVAHRVGFTQLTSTGGLNGLFEFDPQAGPVIPAQLTASTFGKVGATFSAGGFVTSLVTTGDVTYAAGNFTAPSVSNIIAVNSRDSTTQNLGGGLNGGILSMVLRTPNLFVGGRFSSTADNRVTGLSNCAVYDTSKNTWSPMGAGVDGTVTRVVAMTMNITSSTPEIVVALSGSFKTLASFGNNPSVPVNGFAVWVPSQNNWLNNLNTPIEGIEGFLSSSLLDVPGADALYGGSLTSSSMVGNGAAQVFSNTVSRFPVKIQASTSSANGFTKRDTLPGAVPSGVLTGLFDMANGRNKTVLGGHFTATATNGSNIENLLIIDNNSNQLVTGLGAEISPNSTFLALAAVQDTLFAGGNITGRINGAQVNGLVTYNLATNNFITQPPSLNGGGNGVTSLALRPNTGDVYVGGSFASAGALGCPAVCIYGTAASQWTRPGTGLSGSVNTMFWANDNTLVVGGSLMVNGSTATSLATYNAGNSIWDTFNGASNLPGPVSVLTAGSSDGNQIWVAGTAANGSVYLMKYDGSNWKAAGKTLAPGTNIRGLQIFSLSSNHDSTDLLEGGQALMLTGRIVMPNFGNASAAVFDGSNFTPYALTTSSGDSPGSISQIFVQNKNFFTSSSGGRLPLVAIVLIGLGISLFLMLLIVAAGLFLDRLRKKREGYTPAPTSMIDRGSGIQRIPPGQLLESLGKGRAGAPTV